MLFEIIKTKWILSLKGTFEYYPANSLLAPVGAVRSPAHALRLRIPALDTGRKGICQNKAALVNAKWVVCGVIVLVCHELFHFEREPTPGSVHKECIRLRGCGGLQQSWHTCQKRSQLGGSDVSVSAQGWEGAQPSQALPGGSRTALSLGGWLCPHTWAPWGSRGGSDWQTPVVPEVQQLAPSP